MIILLNLLNIKRVIILNIQRIDLHIQARGEYQPAWDEINISLPKGELRSLFINGHPINKISLKSIK